MNIDPHRTFADAPLPSTISLSTIRFRRRLLLMRNMVAVIIAIILLSNYQHYLSNFSRQV